MVAPGGGLTTGFLGGLIGLPLIGLEGTTMGSAPTSTGLGKYPNAIWLKIYIK